MTKVVVAMSGGVDSSVAAALLVERGFEVVGMMLRLWSEAGREDSNRCCTPEAMSLARRVAGQLGIPFYVVDAKEVFRRNVVQAFLEGYALGQTPNPCLICNREVRWTFLLQHALALGAEFMATGHYARTRPVKEGGIQLLRAVDGAKDQSYVLHVLNQAQLRRAIFPIGDLLKPEVRSIAGRLGLPTAGRRESQDLCFLAGGDYRDFLRRNGPIMESPGVIVNREGAVLGHHAGLANYTIGQRKGLGLAGPQPLYVLEKRSATKELVVGIESELGCRRLVASDVSWISGTPIAGPMRAEVKTRYTAREQAANVAPLEQGRGVEVEFDTSQRDITPGQAAVIYQGEVLLGGGIIREGK